MRHSLKKTLELGKYVMGKRMSGQKRFPIVLMLEPLHACNLTCTGCGRIREYEGTLRQVVPVEKCLEAVDECGAPVVSICGGEPLIYKEIGRLTEELLARKKYVYLCTNGVFMAKRLGEFRPDPRFFFNVHLDGMKRSHDAAHAFLTCLTTFGACQICQTWAQVLAVAAVCAVLLVLARIDAYTGLLPDVLTQPLLWAGLIFHLLYSVVPLEQSVLGAVAGYMPLWLVAIIFERLTGRPAIGHGDFKFAAALGAWVGVTLVPLVLLVASCMASVACCIRWFKTGQGATVAMPFGPFLSFAGGLGIFACFWPLS